jgi:hypothetical protein
MNGTQRARVVGQHMKNRIDRTVFPIASSPNPIGLATMRELRAVRYAV